MKESESTFSFTGACLRAGTFVPARWPSALALAFTFCATHYAAAEGFRNPPPGAFDLGRAGGRIADVNDASAVHHNPANLVDLPAPEIQFTPSIVYIRTDFESAGTGQSASTEEPWKLLPNLFAAKPLCDGKAGVGLGITTPYGLANQWDDDSSAFAPFTGVLRYQSPFFARLMTINFNPGFAIKVGDRVSLGAGVDVMWSKLTLKQYYPWFLVTGNFADPDGRAEAEATGVGFGANFGITWQMTERQRLALTMRTPVEVKYDGDFRVNNVPASLGGGTIKGDFKSRIKYPTIIAAGYGIKLTETIRVEADLEWLQFSNFKNLPLNSATAASLGFPTSVSENWRDTITIGIAADWKFAQNWVLRAGYQHYQSPVPDSTFSPTIPDANQNVFTIGLGYTRGRHAFEFGYGLDFYDDRNITTAQNPAFNGKYENTVHLFSLAYRYSFR